MKDKELIVVEVSNTPEANIDFANLTNYTIECIKIGSKHQMSEKVNEIEYKLKTLNELAFDTAEYAEEHIKELTELIRELNVNFAMYVNCRTHLILNSKN